MAGVEPPTLQLVDGAGAYDRDGFASFCRDVALPERGLSYAVVAIMGPQSSGKSTLMNNLFGTRFRMMDFLKGRGQTTQGIWLAAAQVPLETFTLVLDLEGTDGRERGEDDTAFEKQSSLFALATADVIMVNMWCHDIGREHAANKPLLKTVFQVMMRLFLPRKATLLFVIRDKTKTPIESLEPILREDLDKIWTVVPKPEQHKDTSIGDFFNVEVTWLPNFEEKEEEFMERVALLRQRFQKSIEPGGIAGDRAQVVPASALPLSFEEIWKRIRLNKDLDLPAHKVMVATVRCEQIAEEKLQLLLASEEWASLREAVGSATEALAAFGAVAQGLALNCLGSYDEEAAFFEESVRVSKREHLLKEIREAVVPIHEAALAHVSSTSLEAFKEALEQATGGTEGSAANFAASSQHCQSRCLTSFAAAMQGMEVPALGLGTAAAQESFESAMRAHTEQLRARKLQDLQENAMDFLVSGLVPTLTSLLEAGKPQAWEHIRRAWAEETSVCQEELGAALQGFALTPEESRSITAGVEAAARKAVEDKTRELAKRALGLMKERFTAVFMHDAQGMPQRWTASVDVPRKASDARLAALHVLAAVAAMQLEAKGPQPSAATDGKDGGSAPSSLQRTPSQAHTQGAPSDPVLARLLPLLESDTEAAARSSSRAPADPPGSATPSGSDRQAPDSQPQAQGPSAAERRSIFATKGEGKGSLIRLWDNIPASDTFLTPEECRSLWKQFTQETMFQLAQALQAQEASNGSSWLPPPWTIGMMLLLGFNEIMALLRNPLLVLLLAALFFFGRAVWAQLEGEDIFQHGMIPGLLALSSRLGPAVVTALHTVMERMVRLLEALGEQHRLPSQYAHAGAHARPHAPASPPPVDSSVANGSSAEGSSTSVPSAPLGGQQLRHRSGTSTRGE